MISFEDEKKVTFIDCRWCDCLNVGGLFGGSGHAKLSQYLVCEHG